MKRIEAVIRSEASKRIADRLRGIGLGATFMNAEGAGNQRPPTQTYRDNTTQGWLHKDVLVLVVSDELVDAACEIITGEVRTGEIGDGKIIVSDISKVIRIRDGKTGKQAVSLDIDLNVISIDSSGQAASGSPNIVTLPPGPQDPLTSMLEPHAFDDAVMLFQDLLRQNGYSANLIWVEPSDVVLAGHAIYVKLPVPIINLARARNRFEDRIRDGLGLTFGTICELPKSTLCYAWVPKIAMYHQRQLMGIIVSIRTGSSRITGTAVTSRLRWWLLKFRYRQYFNAREHLFGS